MKIKLGRLNGPLSCAHILLVASFFEIGEVTVHKNPFRRWASERGIISHPLDVWIKKNRDNLEGHGKGAVILDGKKIK